VSDFRRRKLAKIPSTSEIRDTAGFAGGLLRQTRLAWRLFRDSRVPGWVKVIPIGALIYLLSPIDLVPGFILPGIGQVDDLVLLLLALKAFVDVSPPGIVREHLQQLFGETGDLEPTRRPSSGGTTIDAPYRIVNDDGKKQ
jgi:uncharacterized membrane protein YkvA (DUF1232 family)